MDTALMLAGGSSRRFGRPKALEVVAGKTILARAVEAIAPLAGEVVISIAEAPMAEALRHFLPRATFVTDRRRGKGPIEGLMRGIEVARGERVLVAPCDAPLLRPDLYRLLLASLGTHDAAVPKLDVFDPVRAVYRTAAVRRILSAAKVALPSPSSLVDRLDAVFVLEDQLRAVDPELDSFLDVNDASGLEPVLARLISTSHSA
ncbi:MAG TPA: molybdenum cofactor guanylyltransferase [Thermoplasmata archaeon]|nr:molybdenum cofactor guanylyltransferase [Thermoplasmata archaeon]